jgi:hypothetical protein
MRRIAHIVVTLSLLAVLVLPQAGCQFFSKLQTFAELGTASIENPVTKDRLQKVEAGAVLVFTGLNAWRDACEQGAINESCREQIRAVQIYSMQIPPYLKELRKFVRTNDQVNASVVFNQIVDLVGIVKGKAAENGVVIQEPR